MKWIQLIYFLVVYNILGAILFSAQPAQKANQDNQKVPEQRPFRFENIHPESLTKQYPVPTPSNVTILVERAFRNRDWATAKKLIEKYPETAAKPPINSSAESWLISSIRAGQRELVALLLKHGAGKKENLRSGIPQYPLHMAAQSGDPEIVELLLLNGFNANDLDMRKSTPLGCAVSSHMDFGGRTNSDTSNITKQENEKRRLETIRILLQHGADPYYAKVQNSSEMIVDYAAINSQPGVLDLLLTNGPISKTVPFSPDHRLHLAVMTGHKETVELLLQTGLNLNTTNRMGLTPLQMVAFRHFRAIRTPIMEEKIQEIAKLLILHGARPDLLSFAALGNLDGVQNFLKDQPGIVRLQDPSGQTALHWAVQHGHTNIINELLHAGANTSAIDQFGRTALHVAALRGSAYIVGELLTANTDLTLKDKDGRTALDLALIGNHESVVQLLLAKSGTGIIIEGSTPLHSAVRSRNPNLVQSMVKVGYPINGKDECGKTPLFIAVEQNQLEAIHYLLQQGANINAQDTNGATPLFYWRPEIDKSTISNEHWQRWMDGYDVRGLSSYSSHLTYHSLNLLEYLCKAGADVTQTNHQGFTVLHKLTRQDNIFFALSAVSMVMKTLVQNGLDMNARDIEGRTALHLAVSKENTMSSLALVQALIHCKANLSISDLNGKTPLHYACSNILFYAGNGLQKSEQNIVSLLLMNGANVNATDAQGMTPLHILTGQKRGFIAQWLPLLLDAKADVNRTNIVGQTPLHILLSDPDPRMDINQPARMLIQAGADVNIQDNHGQTPLHYWAKVNSGFVFERNIQSLSEILITEKANLNVQDDEGNSPLHIASEVGNAQIVKALVKQKANIALRNKAGINPVQLMRSLLYSPPALSSPFRRITPRISSMSGEPHPFFAAVLEGDFDQIKKFLDVDPSLLQATNYWGRPLDRVVLDSNRPDLVEFLKGQGAKVNGLMALSLNQTNLLQQVLLEHPEEITNIVDRLTLLDRAVAIANIPMVKVLLEAGSNPNQWDNQGRTALYYARTNGNMLVEQMLREAGAQESLFDLLHLKDTTRLEQIIEEGSLDLNKTNYIGFTVLHAAAVLENETAVQRLLNQKVKTEIVDYMGFTPLHYAAGYGLKAIASMLLEAGADANVRQARPRTGHTPLHLAAKYGHEEIIRLLIAKGASITATDDLGKTPKEWAEFQTEHGISPGLSFLSKYDPSFTSDRVFAFHLSFIYSRKPVPKSVGLSSEIRTLLSPPASLK